MNLMLSSSLPSVRLPLAEDLDVVGGAVPSADDEYGRQIHDAPLIPVEQEVGRQKEKHCVDELKLDENTDMHIIIMQYHGRES